MYRPIPTYLAISRGDGGGGYDGGAGPGLGGGGCSGWCRMDDLGSLTSKTTGTMDMKTTK